MKKQFEHLLTPRVLKLKAEAEALLPGQPVALKVMKDRDDLKRSAGASVVSSPSGKETIYIDPSRADEYMLAHELMHVILHREGWPSLYYLFKTGNRAAFERRLADALDNEFDHFLFHPRLDAMGFDNRPYREWFVRQIEKWPTRAQDIYQMVFYGISALDGLLLGEPYRTKITKLVLQTQPDVLPLALELERLMQGADRTSKMSVRRQMVVTLRFINRWINTQIAAIGSPILGTSIEFHVDKAIGVDPLFADHELEMPGSEVVRYSIGRERVEGKLMWVASLARRSDQGRFYAQIAESGQHEPPEFSPIRTLWPTAMTKDYLIAIGAAIETSDET